MAFTPQPDGAYVVGANSYCTVQFFKDYWTDSDSARLVGLTDSQIQEGLVNASAWIDQFPWVGDPTSDIPSEKRLAWPRMYAVTQRGNPKIRPGFDWPTNLVPIMIREAVCVVAMEDIQERVNVQDDPREKLASKETGPIKKEFAAPLAGRRFPLAEQMVRGLWKIRTGPPGSYKLNGTGSAYDDRPPLRGERLTDLEAGIFPGGAAGNEGVR